MEKFIAGIERLAGIWDRFADNLRVRPLVTILLMSLVGGSLGWWAFFDERKDHKADLKTAKVDQDRCRARENEITDRALDAAMEALQSKNSEIKLLREQLNKDTAK